MSEPNRRGAAPTTDAPTDPPTNPDGSPIDTPADAAAAAEKAEATRLKMQTTVPLELKDALLAKNVKLSDDQVAGEGVTLVSASIYVKTLIYADLGIEMPEAEKHSAKQKYATKEDAQKAQRDAAKTRADESARALFFFKAIKAGQTPEQAEATAEVKMQERAKEQAEAAAKAEAKKAEEAAKAAATASTTPPPTEQPTPSA